MGVRASGFMSFGMTSLSPSTYRCSTLGALSMSIVLLSTARADVHPLIRRGGQGQGQGEGWGWG